MARLPGPGDWLIQMVGDDLVHLFQRGSEIEIVRFNPANPESFGPALAVIATDPRLDVEQRSVAHFWCGYFFAHAETEVWF